MLVSSSPFFYIFFFYHSTIFVRRFPSFLLFCSFFLFLLLFPFLSPLLPPLPPPTLHFQFFLTLLFLFFPILFLIFRHLLLPLLNVDQCITFSRWVVKEEMEYFTAPERDFRVWRAGKATGREEDGRVTPKDRPHSYYRFRSY